MADYIGTQGQSGFPRQNRYPTTNTIWGNSRVQQDPTSLFFDSFDASIDTANKWAISNGGGGVLPAYTVASATLSSGTTLNGFSVMKTIPTFPPRQPSLLIFETAINIEFPVLATGYRFWGFGNAPTTPTIAAPVTDGVGFEVSTTGQMYCVSWAAGTRNVIADLSPSTGNGAQPQNGGVHGYFVYFRANQCFFAIDQPDNVVALFPNGAPGPNVNTLPMTYVAVSNGSTAVTLVVNGVSMGDYGRNNISISDGTFAFRQMTVGVNGGLANSPLDGSKATYSASVTGLVGLAGDIFILNGSTTKTIRVTHVEFSGIATAAADMDVSLIKRSTADTAGTAAAATPHDSASAAASAVAQSYTAAPTPGTTVGTAVRVAKVEIATAAAQAQFIVWDFGNRPSQAVVLRGVAQGLAMNVSATQLGALYDISYEWTEE